MILSIAERSRGLRLVRRSIFAVLATTLSPYGALSKTPPFDFHGLLFKCDGHPTVQVSGRIAYAYEPDLTTASKGTAALKGGAVTVSFPDKYGAFTIEKRGNRFYADGKQCQADDI